jgi:dsDNA-binding SOS-regulon protein
MILENISKKEMDLKNVTLLIAKDKLSLSKQILVKEVEKLKSKQKSRLRLFFAAETKSDLSVILTNNKTKGEFNLKRNFL